MRSIRFARFIFVLFMAALLRTSLPAETLLVDYCSGAVSRLSNNEWQTVSIGESITDSDTVRLGPNAVVELRCPDATITLSREGTYAVDRLLTSQRQQKRAGLGSILSSKIRSLFGKREHQTQNSAGGIRGAEVEDDSDALAWFEGDVEEMINEGKQLLEENDYAEALTVFQDAYDSAFDPVDEEKSLFFTGYTFMMMGRTDEALNSLTDLSPDPSADYYFDYFFVTGKLLIDTYAYEEAADFLTTFNDKHMNTEQVQMITFLTGVAYNGTGAIEPAEQYLETSHTLDPVSDVGIAARELINQPD